MEPAQENGMKHSKLSNTVAHITIPRPIFFSCAPHFTVLVHSSVSWPWVASSQSGLLSASLSLSPPSTSFAMSRSLASLGPCSVWASWAPPSAVAQWLGASLSSGCLLAAPLLWRARGVPLVACASWCPSCLSASSSWLYTGQWQALRKAPVEGENG